MEPSLKAIPQEEHCETKLIKNFRFGNTMHAIKLKNFIKTFLCFNLNPTPFNMAALRRLQVPLLNMRHQVTCDYRQYYSANTIIVLHYFMYFATQR